MSESHEWRVRVEFDVETDAPSPIDAAFAAADWLQRRADHGRFSYMVYSVASHRAIPIHGTSFVEVDLEQVQDVEATSDYADYVADVNQERWHVYVEPLLMSGRRAARPLVVRKGDRYARKSDRTVVRFSNPDAAQSVADSLNRSDA